MTVSKDGLVTMYLLTEENFLPLEKETGVPAETWANAYEYDVSFDLKSKIYVVPRKDETPPVWRQMVAELIPQNTLVVWPEETPEDAAEHLGYFFADPSRHYLMVDVMLTTDVNF